MRSPSSCKFFLSIVFLIIVSSCKKDAGKHCPVVMEDKTSLHTDLTPVKDISAIMDTLAAHPELNPYRAQLVWGIADPNMYTATVECNIYYKDVVIFNEYYGISISNSGYTYYSKKLPVNVNEISVIPSISRTKAESIASESIKFDYCPSSTLGIMNFSSDKTPMYKLVWRIRQIEGGFPIVFLDAQTGEIYSESDGYVD